MTVKFNDVDGALVTPDGGLQPIAGSGGASGADGALPDAEAMAPVPVAMTGGRQLSAARRAPGDA